MDEYPKIQTAFRRDPNTHKVERGQFSSDVFDYLSNLQWEFTEKVDGTNIRVMWDGKSVRFGGRTNNAQIPVSLLDMLNGMFSVEEFVLAGCPPMCLYGEGYGNKIQKVGSKYIPDGVSFILFDVLCDGWWLRHSGVLDIAQKLGVTTVPRRGNGTLLQAADFVCDGFQSSLGDVLGEGLVLRPVVQLFDRKGQRIIGKLKTKDFA